MIEHHSTNKFTKSDGSDKDLKSEVLTLDITSSTTASTLKDAKDATPIVPNTRMIQVQQPQHTQSQLTFSTPMSYLAFSLKNRGPDSLRMLGRTTQPFLLSKYYMDGTHQALITIQQNVPDTFVVCVAYCKPNGSITDVQLGLGGSLSYIDTTFAHGMNREVEEEVGFSLLNEPRQIFDTERTSFFAIKCSSLSAIDSTYPIHTITDTNNKVIGFIYGGQDELESKLQECAFRPPSKDRNAIKQICLMHISDAVVMSQLLMDTRPRDRKVTEWVC